MTSRSADDTKARFVRLKEPGISHDDMLQVYSEWTEKADYDSVRFFFVKF